MQLVQRSFSCFFIVKDKESNSKSSGSSSSDSDSSDDDDVAFNPKFDQEFFKTLSSLRRKDPTIYEKATTFFEDVAEDTTADNNTVANNKSQKKLTVKQYEQDILLNNGGVYDEDTSDENEKRPQSPTYNEEQKIIKNELKKALESDDSHNDNDFGGLFVKREKSKEEQVFILFDHLKVTNDDYFILIFLLNFDLNQEKEDEQHSKWLEEHGELKEKNINEIWSNVKLSKDEKFLRDYILSNGYADKDDDEIPTYDEIVADDDDFEEKQTEFEHKYNFRYEDPDQEFIKRYPRTIDNSVRKVDNKRKEKRVERRERKEHEKKEQFREVEMLKELKRKEIEEKIARLKSVTGDEELNIADIDLDGDFDPDEYDKKMNKIFNDEYYQIDEGEEKPEAPSDIEDLQVENYDDFNANEEQENYESGEAHCEDDDFNMDCDYDGTIEKKHFQQEIIDSTRSKRKHRKRKSRFMEMLETKKPSFDPNDKKTFGEYLDEYYKLDCEDIIGDVKCRFKYVETVPCDYGLSVEEVSYRIFELGFMGNLNSQ